MISVRSVRPIYARLQSATCLGFLLGGLDALTVVKIPELLVRVRIVMAGASVGALGGALIGLGGVLLLRFLAAIRRLPRVSQLRCPSLTGVRTMSFVLAGVGALAVFALILKASERVMLESLRLIVIALGAAVSIAVALLGANWAESMLGCWSRKTDERHGPSIASRSLLFALGGVAPTLIVSVPLLVIYGPELGCLRLFLFMADFVVLNHWMFLFLKPRRHKKVWRFVSGKLLWGLIIIGQVFLRPGSVVSQRLAQAQALPDVLDLLQRLTDVDRDGYSGMFGGRDCAPFDSSRHPGAHDIPGNGIDENCDGRDATLGDSRLDVEPKFSGHISLNTQPLNVVWYIVQLVARRSPEDIWIRVRHQP